MNFLKNVSIPFDLFPAKNCEIYTSNVFICSIQFGWMWIGRLIIYRYTEQNPTATATIFTLKWVHPSSIGCASSRVGAESCSGI